MFARPWTLHGWSSPPGAVVLALLLGAAALPAQDTDCDQECVSAVETALAWAAADLDRLAAEIRVDAARPVIVAASDRTEARSQGALGAATLRSIAANASPRWNTAPESIAAYVQAKDACTVDASAQRCQQAAHQSAVGVWQARPATDGSFHVEVWVEVLLPQEGKPGVTRGRGATLEVTHRDGDWVVSEVLLRVAGRD